MKNHVRLATAFLESDWLAHGGDTMFINDYTMIVTTKQENT